MRVKRRFIKKYRIRDFIFDRRRRKKVEYINSTIKCFDRKGSRKTSLNQQCANCIINCSNHSLKPSILLGCVWARKMEFYSFRSKEIMKLSIIVLASIITLKRFNVCVELSDDICMKLNEIVEHFTLFAKKKYP